jgi:hypothetical protein
MTQNDMLNQTQLQCNAHGYKSKTITWSAVIAGGLMAFGLTFLFNLITIGVGLAIFPDTAKELKEMAYIGFIWTVLGAFVIMFFAGWKTGALIKLCPMHFGGYATPVNATTVQATPVYHKSCFCAHAMTHGFLAWVFHLMISLVFFIFVAQIASASYLRSSFLNLPVGYSVTDVIDVDVNKSANNAVAKQDNSTGQVNPTPATQAAAQKAGSNAVALFLIFVMGAVGAAVGSAAGLASHKKCLAKKLGNV